MLRRSLNSLDAIPRRGRSTRSLNAFARRSNCVLRCNRQQDQCAAAVVVVTAAGFRYLSYQAR
jgi:hypothetical protein